MFHFVNDHLFLLFSVSDVDEKMTSVYIDCTELYSELSFNDPFHNLVLCVIVIYANLEYYKNCNSKLLFMKLGNLMDLCLNVMIFTPSIFRLLIL